ncbi:MAG: MFS transporter [Ancalomicrobiaceae bacterium]|nr:MFS transporter [Ancalomicrobiaceae bacterium]
MSDEDSPVQRVPYSAVRRIATLPLIAAGMILGICGIDLILPALPDLPAALGSTPAAAQLVVAAYVAGTAIGLISFGELASKVDPRRLLSGSLALFGIVTLLAGQSQSMEWLIGMRFVQGMVSAAPAVFAPGFIRAMYEDHQAIRAIGFLGSINSIAPALAPIIGGWLSLQFGWRSSFWVTGALAIALALGLSVSLQVLPRIRSKHHAGGYGALLVNPTFIRYCLGHALSLAGIVAVVFGAPVVIIGSLGGEMKHFMYMQICGVSSFVVAANFASTLAIRFGVERMLYIGSGILVAGLVALLVWALAGAGDAIWIVPPWAVVNIGFGLRAPTGFFCAVKAAQGDDARGAALVMLIFLGTTSAATAAIAPIITLGLVPVAATATAFALLALAVMAALPALKD